MYYIISKQYDQKQIKQYLQNELKLSAKMITRLKTREDGIMLNGSRVTVRALLSEGDSLSLNTEQEDKLSDRINAVNIPLDIIFEDDHYIVFNKPANMPTHASHDHYDDTLANGIAYLYKERGQPFVFRAVNRLDRDTSGIVIFAKSSDAASKFSKLQQNKLVSKKYTALVAGITEACGSIKGYIKRQEDSIMLRQFSEDKSNGGAFSHTDYKTLEVAGDSSLLELCIHTGRTHQIRVSAQYIGHPVLGDSLYGQDEEYSRHMLHAHKIEFVHPFTEKQISLTAPIPQDMKDVMTEKGFKYDRE